MVAPWGLISSLLSFLVLNKWHIIIANLSGFPYVQRQDIYSHSGILVIPWFSFSSLVVFLGIVNELSLFIHNGIIPFNVPIRIIYSRYNLDHPSALVPIFIIDGLPFS